jgi:hypothetical protein
MSPWRHWWQPRYDVRLLRGDDGAPPILIWSRHRVRAVAARCRMLDERDRDLGQARLVVFDRWTGKVVGHRARFRPVSGSRGLASARGILRRLIPNILRPDGRGTI